MKIMVCDFPDEMHRKPAAWSALVDYAATARPDLIVLPEMPFCSWVFVGDAFVPGVWREALEAHDRMLARMPELGVRHVMSSRPTERDGQRRNEAFIWSADAGCRIIRAKWYLPDAPSSREMLWFDRGDKKFAPVTVDDVRIGFQLCSETMYPEHARELGLAGSSLIVQPRATNNHRRWSVAAEMSAITSGCFVASVNRRSYERDWFSGGSCVLSPEAEVLALATADNPIVTVTLDLTQAEVAKSRYPRDLHRVYG